jgi:CheY-like chemotaxis protein
MRLRAHHSTNIAQDPADGSMVFSFDGYNLGRVLEEAERAGTGARDLERLLLALVETLEADASSTLAAATGEGIPGDIERIAIATATASFRPSTVPSYVLACVRSICIDARTHRLVVDGLVTRLIGAPASADGSPSRPRVLVVDDSQANLDVVAMVLDGAGFDALTARDGLEGVLVAHYAKPAVILMDLAMPVLNGMDATRLLKGSAATRDLNVIAHTAEAELRDPSGSGLFVDVVKKPATPEAILASVRRFISAGPSPASSKGS